MTESAHGNRTGYKLPPVSTRFAMGRSGNPGGRPKGRSNGIPYDSVLGQKVLVRDNGTECHVTAAEAFLLHLTKSGLADDGAATRASLAAIEEARAMRVGDDGTRVGRINRIIIAPGNPNSALRLLQMARKLDRYRTTAYILLEPWLVEAALARLGDRRLSTEEQCVIRSATRTPHKVRWPAWWDTE